MNQYQVHIDISEGNLKKKTEILIIDSADSLVPFIDRLVKVKLPAVKIRTKSGSFIEFSIEDQQKILNGQNPFI